jgi:hypothetical protein
MTAPTASLPAHPTARLSTQHTRKPHGLYSALPLNRLSNVLKESQKTASDLVARSIVWQVSIETAKMLPRGVLPNVASEPVLTESGRHGVLRFFLASAGIPRLRPVGHETRFVGPFGFHTSD